MINGTVSNLDGDFIFIIVTFENRSTPMIFITNLNCLNLNTVISYIL